MKQIQYFSRVLSINTRWLSQQYKTTSKATQSLIEYCADCQIITGFGRMPYLNSNFFDQNVKQLESKNTLDLSKLVARKIRKSAFLHFFSEKNMEVPQQFKKSASLHRSITQRFAGKFIAILQRHGQRITASKVFIAAAHIISAELFDKKAINFQCDWLFLLHCFSVIKTNGNTSVEKKTKISNFSLNQFSKVAVNINFSTQGKIFQQSLSLLNILEHRFKRVQPLYQFKFAKVDKKIRKFSRGKINKYQCILQYVPKFRRESVLMRWLINEINFDLQEKWGERISNVLAEFLYDSNSTLFALNLRMMRIAYVQKRHRMLRMGQYRVRHK